MRHNHPVSGSCGNIYRRNRRLNSEQQAIVKELLKEHKHEFALKEYIQRNVIFNLPISIFLDTFQVCLTTADVRNLKRKLKPKKSDRNLLGLTLKSLGNDGYAELITDEDGSNRVISFTSPDLVKSFLLYPEVVHICEVPGGPFLAYRFAVVDRQLVNRTVMFAFFLDQSACETFGCMLNSFKHLMQSKADEIETIFTVANFSICHEIRHELPHARVLFYRDSLLQDVGQHLEETALLNHDKKSIYRNFVTMMRTRDRGEYLTALQTIAVTSPAFWNIIEQTWIPYAEQWAEHLRLSQLTFGIEDRGVRNSTVAQFESILKTERNLDLCAKRLLEVAVAPKNHDEITLKRDFLGQPDDIQALLRLLSEPVVEVVLRHLETMTPISDICPDLSARRCFCSFNLRWRLPCIHLMKAARLAYIPLTNLLKDSRWLEPLQTEYSDVVDVEETVVEVDCEADTLSPGAKLMKIDMQLQSIQEMVVSSDADKFKRRQRELKELESRWLQEDGSLPGTSVNGPS